MVREENTGKSRGFAFLKYEDARSCVLAVDNITGSKILGRSIRVDHVEKYRLPKHLLEKEEAISTNPGHAYEGKELASEFRLDHGQDLFAKPQPSTDNDAKERHISNQERKEGKRKRREEREAKRRKKEARREEREERKRLNRSKKYRESDDEEDNRQKKKERHRRKHSFVIRSFHGNIVLCTFLRIHQLHQALSQALVLVDCISLIFSLSCHSCLLQSTYLALSLELAKHFGY